MEKEIILKKINKIDDKLLVSKLLDKAIKSAEIHKILVSDFLDPYQKTLTERALANCEDIKYTLNGGYAGAERQIIIFCPKNMSIEDYPYSIYPFKSIEIKLKGRDTITHRDVLGSLMSLGIKREKIGDILVNEETCTIVVISEIADYIKYNLTKIKNVKVDIEVKDIEELFKAEPKIKEINSTVASLRLDCIASVGFGVSRSKVVEYIRAEKVNINWEITDNITKQVREGDTLSIRGKGRVVVDKIGGNTRKGRINVVLKKFI